MAVLERGARGQAPFGVPARRSWPGWPDAAAAVVLIGLVWTLYAPCLDGAFVFDDVNAVAQSALIRSFTPLSRYVALSTRPLTDLSLAADYARGGLAVRPYHRTNVLLHALNCVLLYVLAWLTLGTATLAARYGPARRWIAFAAAAAFAAHPLATETVAYVSSRSEVLAVCRAGLTSGRLLDTVAYRSRG